MARPMPRKCLTFAFSCKAQLLMIILLALTAVLLGQSQPRQLAGKAAKRITITDRLELGRVIHAKLEAGQPNSYVVALEAGQYMRVVVSKSDLAIALRLLSMDRTQTFLALTLRGPVSRREPICWIAKVSGYYRLELAAFEEVAGTQAYTIQLAELRTSVPVDEKRIVAQGLFDQARASIMQGRPQKAVEILQRALPLSRDAKDLEREAAELSSIGLACVQMSQHEKAISFSEQALAVWREIKDRQE